MVAKKVISIVLSAFLAFSPVTDVTGAMMSTALTGVASPTDAGSTEEQDENFVAPEENGGGSRFE